MSIEKQSPIDQSLEHISEETRNQLEPLKQSVLQGLFNQFSKGLDFLKVNIAMFLKTIGISATTTPDLPMTNRESGLGSPSKMPGSNYFYPVPLSSETKEAGYPADSGLDIASPKGTPAYAVASGTIIYSERGHTPWGTTKLVGIDTPNSVLLKLDEPLKDKQGKEILAEDGKPVRYLWYTHLSELTQQVHGGKPIVHIQAGDQLGKTGLGNNNPHLHIGLLSDPSQKNGSVLQMASVRDFFGLQKTKTTLASNNALSHKHA